MLDSDLAELYQAPTKALNQAVRRNLDRFPEDFMFRLSPEESEALNRSQIVTGSQKHRDPRYPPFAFTELRRGHAVICAQQPFQQFMPDEIVAVCAPRIRDPKLRRAIGNLKSAQDLQHLPLIWRERGAGTRATVEQALKEHGLNVRQLDQRVEIESTEAIKALVIAEIGIAFFSGWEIQNELATGTMREIHIPDLRIHRVFSWALPSGDLAVFLASSIDSPIRSEPNYLPSASGDGRDWLRQDV